MKRAAALIAVVALLAVPAVALAQEPFTATLTPDAEVPPAAVPDGYAGTGDGTFTINDDGTEIAYQVNYEGLTGDLLASHIHYGDASVAGGVILPLDIGTADTSGMFSGTLTEADFTAVEGGPQTFAEALDAIRAGDTYVNLHTEMNASGELRGQLTAGELPDTATDGQPVPGSGWTLLLAAIGLGALLVAGRRFAFRRA